MTYEVTLEKCGSTKTVVIEDVKSEGEAKDKATIMVCLMEGDDRYHVSRTKLIKSA